MTASSRRPPLSDSPWFWVYLFTTFALIVLMFMLPRVRDRQAQIERKAQGRQRAVEQAAGGTPQTPLSTPEKTVIPFAPLFAILGAVWVLAWIMLRKRFRSRPTEAESELARGASPDAKRPTDSS
jgi:flagellar biosynthesis/type III secretory pathway M-ring protein FliF/YscJ